MVQRTPDLLDAARPELGRRFVVTYFRWLGPADIYGVFSNQGFGRRCSECGDKPPLARAKPSSALSLQSEG
jgi:hypothetical protein